MKNKWIWSKSFLEGIFFSSFVSKLILLLKEKKIDLKFWFIIFIWNFGRDLEHFGKNAMDGNTYGMSCNRVCKEILYKSSTRLKEKIPTNFSLC